MKDLEQDIRSCGLRVTKQRIAVYDWLRRHPVHPTADRIWSALLPDYPDLSLTTVYNTVNVLAAPGLIRTLNIRSEEQRFDGNPADHGHFSCRGCGAVLDFDIDAPRIASMLPQGCTAEKCDVFVTGLCTACAE